MPLISLVFVCFIAIRFHIHTYIHTYIYRQIVCCAGDTINRENPMISSLSEATPQKVAFFFIHVLPTFAKLLTPKDIYIRMYVCTGYILPVEHISNSILISNRHEIAFSLSLFRTRLGSSRFYDSTEPDTGCLLLGRAI